MERRTITPAELVSLVAVAALALFAVSAAVLGSGPGADVVDRVYVLLQWTRLEAVARGTDCRLEIDPASAVARVVESGDGRVLHATEPMPDFRLFRTGPAPGAAAGPIDVPFSPSGRPADGASGLLVRTGREDGVLWIDSDGAIRAESLSRQPRKGPSHPAS